MNTPGFAVIRTKRSDGSMSPIWTYPVDAERAISRWRGDFKDSEHFTYSLHRIESEPVVEEVAAS